MFREVIDTLLEVPRGDFPSLKALKRFTNRRWRLSSRRWDGRSAMLSIRWRPRRARGSWPSTPTSTTSSNCSRKNVAKLPKNYTNSICNFIRLLPGDGMGGLSILTVTVLRLLTFTPTEQGFLELPFCLAINFPRN